MKRPNFGCTSQPDKIGIIVANLGTPEKPTAASLRRYLRQFLSDRRVIEVPRILWWIILNCIVLVFRPRKSAAAYSRIWTDNGSPLLEITRQQAAGLKKNLDDAGIPVEVEVGMRYGNPSLESAVDALCEKGCRRILLFPMYPHYAAATTASTYDAVFPHLLKRRWVPTLRVVEPYFLNEHYINALAETINSSIKNMPHRPEKLLLSYHGVPESYVRKGDPYCCECVETTQALIPLLQTKRDDVIHSFQSRFGSEPWLQPYTDETIQGLGEAGIKRIAVAAPGFIADCLETIDELGNENKHLFQEHGGEDLYLIPCLNAQPAWIKAMTEIAKTELGSWLTMSTFRANPACAACPTLLAKKA